MYVLEIGQVLLRPEPLGRGRGLREHHPPGEVAAVPLDHEERVDPVVLALAHLLPLAHHRTASPDLEEVLLVRRVDFVWAQVLSGFLDS